MKDSQKRKPKKYGHIFICYLMGSGGKVFETDHDYWIV